MVDPWPSSGISSGIRNFCWLAAGRGLLRSMRMTQGKPQKAQPQFPLES